MLRSEAVFPFPSQASLDGRYVRLVGEQVTGINALAVPTTIDAPRGTGYSVPSGFIFRVPRMRTGIGEDAVPQEYAEAFRVQEIANASGREIALWNPSGPVMGGIPLNTPVVVLDDGDGGRFGTRVKILRVGNTTAGAQVQGLFARGAIGSLAAVQAGDTLFAVGGQGYDGTNFAQQATFRAVANENWTGLNRGADWVAFATAAGSIGQQGVLRFRRAAGVTAAEVVSESAALRIIPGANGIAERNNLNTADARFLSADGTIFTLPLTTRMSLPSLPTSPAGLVAGEIWVDTGASNVLKRV